MGSATGKASTVTLGASSGTACRRSSDVATSVMSGGTFTASGSACVDTSRASITDAFGLAVVGGATCTSAISAACSPSEIHTATSGRCRRGGIIGSSKDAFTAGLA